MSTPLAPNHPAWQEYDSAARQLACQGKRGQCGDLLPANMTPEAVQLIADDPEAFERRVRDHAYAIAMERTQPTWFGYPLTWSDEG